MVKDPNRKCYCQTSDNVKVKSKQNVIHLKNTIKYVVSCIFELPLHVVLLAGFLC